MSIVNNALAFLNCEAPAASPDVKPAQDSAGQGTSGPGFAEELKDCENNIPPEPQKPKLKTESDRSELQKPKTQDEEKGDEQKKDNGMPDDPNAKTAVYGIVGILEGFDPPSYQSDNTAGTGTQSVTPVSPPVVQSGNAAQAPPAAQPVIQENAAGTSENQTTANGENTSGLSEQIAWMLQNTKAGSKPVQTQDEILNIVGDYLDSLENTNSQASGTAPLGQGKAANAQNGIAQAYAADTAQAGQTVKTDTAAGAGGKADIEGGQTPARAEMTDAAPQNAAAEVKPATGMPQAAEANAAAEAKPESAKATLAAEAPDAKSADTGKPETRNTAEPVNGATVNTVDPAAYKAETQQTESVQAGAKPETVRESVLKIVDRVSTEASEGKYDFSVDLKPEFMGKVSIKLTMEDGNVKVQIKADDASVKAMLSDQMSNLHYMLKEKGIPVTTIDIANHGETMSGRQENAGQFERRNPHGSAAYEQPAEDTLESAKEKYDFYLGGSYVEYLA